MNPTSKSNAPSLNNASFPLSRRDEFNAEKAAQSKETLRAVLAGLKKINEENDKRKRKVIQQKVIKDVAEERNISSGTFLAYRSYLKPGSPINLRARELAKEIKEGEIDFPTAVENLMSEREIGKLAAIRYLNIFIQVLEIASEAKPVNNNEGTVVLEAQLVEKSASIGKYSLAYILG